MSNRYDHACASALHPAHTADQMAVVHCPDCNADAGQISSNRLPSHHRDLVYSCSQCGLSWQPNQDPA